MEEYLRVLFLTQIIPYPPDSGPKVKTYHVLRYLAERGHQIFLASFMRPEEEGYVAPLRHLCAEVHTVPIQRSRLADGAYWLRSHLSSRPFLIERDDIKGMRQIVRSVLEQEQIDVIHADQLTMAQFGLTRAGRRLQADGGLIPKLVFDAHNATWNIVERMTQTVPPLLRPILRIEAQRIKRYEGMILDVCDHTLAVTDLDKQDLLKAWQGYRQAGASQPPQITTIPIAVDTEALQPAARKPEAMNILTLGTLRYPPNADGIRWFLRDVFPLIRQHSPQATLAIAGRNPPQDLFQLAEDFGGAARVLGFVHDLKPLMQESALVVVPVRAGSGMRVRILEAFAQGMPVVTTTVGLEGIHAVPGRDVLVADTEEAFAQAVTTLLQDAALQEQLAVNGRRLAEEAYDWKAALSCLESAYGLDERC
ncbi:MAG: glycosyltransferase family 4 protein [Chloroflexi bacterium]|nr:glycosyltransferase family 4 protein [Chloroflexota bacterium]